MEEQIKKNEETLMRNEALWGNIKDKLGLSKKKTNKYIQVLQGGGVSIGGNTVKHISGVNLDELMDYDWEKGDLSFLINSKWFANSLLLSLKGSARVIGFEGEWFEGNFVGASFDGKFLENGKSFRGKFESSYTWYKAHPSTFVNGTCVDYENGILGVTKMDPIELNDSTGKKSFYLFELHVGSYCTLTDQKGAVHSFLVDKSCDDTSMDIVLAEQTGGKNKVTLPWSLLRAGGVVTEFNKRASIVLGSNLGIPNLFTNDGVKKIVSVKITKGPTTQVSTTPVVDTFRVESNLIRPLNYVVPQMTVHLFSPDEIKKFELIYKDLNNNAMQMHLQNILDGIKFGIISGYNGYPHLKYIFGNDVGQPLKHPRYEASMLWMDEFVQFVVMRLVKNKKEKGKIVPHQNGRNSIFNELANLIARTKGGPTAGAKPKAKPAKKLDPNLGNFNALSN